MCGIFAAINLESSFSQEDYSKFLNATNLVSYRGPDRTASMIFENGKSTNQESAFNIFLGHNRLSIIDLSSLGNQPMVKNGISLIFNGEIFNYIEIKKELTALGHVFETQTDTEVIIHTYLQYGEKGFAKFNGMWAFVLVDSTSNKIIVSKDRFSIKPLYYFKDNFKIYFSSEIKQILSLKSGFTINKNKILSFLQQSLLNFDEETFYTNINVFPATSNWTIDLNSKNIEVNEYWNYSSQIQKIGLNDAAEKFHFLFDQSIQLRLRGDVKVGSLLSGGLDSSSITVTAKKYDPNFKSFSAIFNQEKYTERKHIDAFKNKTGILNSSYMFSAEDILDNMDNTMYHQEQPFVSFSVVAQNLLFEKIKSESDVVCLLCGQGADEILMGYLKYYYFSLNKNLKGAQFGKFAGNFFGSLYHGTALRNFNFSYAKRYMPFTRGKKANYILQSIPMEKIWVSGELNRRQMADVDHYSVPILNHYEDRNSMASSLEVRLPFLDHELVDFCVNLPYSLKIKNGWTKYIMRKAMKEVPKEILWRRDKEGFVTPEVQWVKKEMKESILMHLKNSKLQEMNIIDAKLFLDEYTKYAEGKKTSITYEEILKVYITEIWLKNIQSNFNITA